MESETKKTETMAVWIPRHTLRDLPQLWDKLVGGTPFAGSRIRATGKFTKRYRTDVRCYPARYEFEVEPTCVAFTPIPGHRLVGFAEMDDGNDTFSVHRVGHPDGWTWTKDVFENLDPKRCDICGVRHNRKRLFVLVRESDGKEVVVGGSCVVKNFPVNLEAEIRKAFRLVELVSGAFEDEDGFFGSFGGGGQFAGFELANVIAISEVLCDTFGFISAKAAGEGGRSTSYWVRRAIDPPKPLTDRHGCPIPDPDADRIKDILESNAARIEKRTYELFETGFAEYVVHFDALNTARWSEFSQNCLTLLRSPSVGRNKVGLAAYIGGVKRKIAESKVRVTEQVVETGFKGEVGKVFDFGKFVVKGVKARDAFNGGIDYGFVCVNDRGEKVWFKVGERSSAWREWEESVGDRIPGIGETIEVSLRGKLKAVKDDISFASNVKFLEVKIVRGNESAA